MADDHKLGERHVGGHLDGPQPIVPLIPKMIFVCLSLEDVIVSEIFANVSFYKNHQLERLMTGYKQAMNKYF